jgi:MYXO-CTERM domain-containing protein
MQPQRDDDSSGAALPEHWQPSSDERIVKWVVALGGLALAALWLRRSGPEV